MGTKIKDAIDKIIPKDKEDAKNQAVELAIDGIKGLLDDGKTDDYDPANNIETKYLPSGVPIVSVTDSNGITTPFYVDAEIDVKDASIDSISFGPCTTMKDKHGNDILQVGGIVTINADGQTSVGGTVIKKF